MTASSPLRPSPPRALLVTIGDGCRAEALRTLVPDLSNVELVQAVPGGESGGVPDPVGFGAVVVDGEAGAHLDAAWVERLDAAARGGTSVLALVTSPAASPSDGTSRWAQWLGIGTSLPQPAGEWYAKVGPRISHGLTDRVQAEFSIVDQPFVLEPGNDDDIPVLNVSIAFTDRVVMFERRIGAGRLVVSGIGASAQALAHPELSTLLRRSLAPVAALTERTQQLGLAVLGYGPYGGMGLYHGLAANATPGLEMIAACDFDPARRKAAEEEFPGLRPYGSVRELAADDDVGVVIVATPPSTHFELARDLLEAGKHVALEKPMCLTVADADDLLALARSSGLVLTVHQSRRWDPDFLAIRRAVGAGDLGELFSVETFVGGFEHPCRAWHSEVSVSGGAVYDWGSHHLDWILLLMGGFPDRLVAHGHKRVWRDITNLDQVRVHLTWADGREAEFVQSDVAGIRRPKFYVQGTAGTIAGHYRPLRTERVEPGVGYVGEDLHHAEAPVELTLARYEPGYGVTETRLPPVPADRYGFHRNLADHLIFGEPLAVTPESARDVVALLEAAQRSTDEGNVPVTLSRPIG
jgi:predicted dehydrogenase